MIIIIRALSPKRKKERQKKAKEKNKGQKNKGPKKGKNEKKMKINKKEARLLSLFPHLCFKVAPCYSYRVSYVVTFIY